MKRQYSLFKSSRSLLIGMLTLMPLTVVHALDTQEQDRSQEQSQSIGTHDSLPPSDQYNNNQRNYDQRGAQGPMRSDMTNTQSAEQERERQRQWMPKENPKTDIDQRLSPISGG